MDAFVPNISRNFSAPLSQRLLGSSSPLSRSENPSKTSRHLLSSLPMEGSSSTAIPGEAPSVDWRTELDPEARMKVVSMIMDSLLRNLPLTIPDGLHELKKVALLLEDKIYTTARSQSDYWQKISLKRLEMSTMYPRLNPAFQNQQPAEPGA